MYAEGAEEFSTGEDCFIYCGVNSHWESHTLELPLLPPGLEWTLYASSRDSGEKGRRNAGRELVLEPRSLTVLISAKKEKAPWPAEGTIHK